MIHALIAKKGPGGGGGGGGSPTVTMNPPGDAYVGDQSVTITVSGPGVAKLRYKNGNGDSWHTVNALFTTITVHPTSGGKDVYGDALDANSVVLASDHEVYFVDGGG